MQQTGQMICILGVCCSAKNTVCPIVLLKRIVKSFQSLTRLLATIIFVRDSLSTTGWSYDSSGGLWGKCQDLEHWWQGSIQSNKLFKTLGRQQLWLYHQTSWITFSALRNENSCENLHNRDEESTQMLRSSTLVYKRSNAFVRFFILNLPKHPAIEIQTFDAGPGGSTKEKLTQIHLAEAFNNHSLDL